MTAANYDPLWYWIREREAIRLKHDAGEAQPWTDDWILRTYRFCNVRREDDLVTRWIREHIREPYHNHPNLWIMLCLARQINWPPTLKYLIENGAWADQADFIPNLERRLREWQAKGNKVYTGAYMISASPNAGESKATYIANVVIGDLWHRQLDFPLSQSLYNVHTWISRSKGWGPFMAYQAVVDMRFTSILNQAHDISTWAAAGPGTLRGLNRIHGRKLNTPLSQQRALDEMKVIHLNVEAETGVTMDFSDIPNTLCETDKYLRVKMGEGRPRARYVPGRGA